MLDWLKSFVFGYDDEEDAEEFDEFDDEEYDEKARPPRKNAKSVRNAPRKEDIARNIPKRPSFSSLVFFEGVPSDEIKLRLRDALLEGSMVLLDLGNLSSAEIEKGRNFINFMGGVAFAHKGELREIGASFFLISPRRGMFTQWIEEPTLDEEHLPVRRTPY
ncbi:hypothetical protein AGMMS50276_21350 [Synergistales bacterium]|nr:hypothetical protein AGMMS50276_21350 [Synergistales bacterium]